MAQSLFKPTHATVSLFFSQQHQLGNEITCGFRGLYGIRVRCMFTNAPVAFWS